MDNHRPELDYGLSDFDVKSHFVSNFIYELPVGRGKRYLSNANRAVGAVIGGWQVGGIVTLQKGFPFSVSANDANCLLDVFFFQAEDGIRDLTVTGVQTCALPICFRRSWRVSTWTTGRSPSSATAACSRATWPTASRPIGRTLRVGSSNERHAGGAGTLQRCHPGAMASAALPRRAAGSRCRRRGRQPALRRPRAADAGARGRARQRSPVRDRKSVV